LKKYNWGIIGTGAIAHVFAKGIISSTLGNLYAIASRNKSIAKSFAEEFNIPFYFGDYEQLLNDDNIDIVYIAIPHPLHAEWSIKAANKGKHILCEKPMSMNYVEACKVIDSVRLNNVFFMEAYMYKFHPQTLKLVSLLREKVIGEVRLIQATFSFHAEPSLEELSKQQARGGGGILDVGGYPMSMARLIAGIAVGKNFENPLDITGVAHIGKITNVDEWSIACLKFPNGILAQISAGTSLVQENTVKIFGSEGEIFLPSPWVPGGREPGITKIVIRKNNNPVVEIILVENNVGLYSIEANEVANNIQNRQSQLMTWDDTLENMQALDRWRNAVGMYYEADKLNYDINI